MTIHTFTKRLAFALAALPLAPAFAAVNFFDPTNPAAVPQTITAAGLYQNINTKVTDTALKYFDVNAALWSDGAAKARWVALPPGTRITYVDTTDVFDYPDRAMFVKNFYIDTVYGDASTRRYWETRLLVNKEDAGHDTWYGFSYRWNAAGTEATYVGESGFDTVAYYHPRGLSQPQSYKKWSFPSASACTQCHRVGNSGGRVTRGVLGFLPPQLKRPYALDTTKNQVDALFDAGVFTGTRPTATEKRARWKGIYEPIPTGITAEERFRIIDTIARSYIAANCSGCHGERNINIASAAPPGYDWDFFRMRPAVEFGSLVVGTLGLGYLDEDTLQSLSDGRYKYVLSLRKAGIDAAPNSPWDLAVPADEPMSTFIYAGFPAYSPLIYRQVAMRKAPWRDSLKLVETLNISDPNNRKAWIFKAPWGSKAWRDSLAAHSVNPVELLNDVSGFSADGLQMPLLATHMPDTAGMRILAEWVRTYRTIYRIEGADSIVNVKGRLVRVPAQSARVQGRIVLVPSEWTGKARMFNVNGRAFDLPSAGRGRYVIPQAAPAGVYLFKVGERSFRASVLK